VARPEPPLRQDFALLERVPTRWMDNDLYGHVNNAHYYAYFDSVINRVLIEQGGLDIHGGPVVGLVVRSSCDYFAPIAYPEMVEVALRTDRIGTTSVEYGLGLFSAGVERARAAGTMVHVFVDRGTSRPVPLPPRLRSALAALRRPGSTG